MKVLVIGSGGREHALAWKIAQSGHVDQVFVAPGNAGTCWPAGDGMAAAENVNIGVDNFEALLAFAQEKVIGLTVVGPEVPLANGIVDLFQSAELPIFGPNKAAAQLEASKAFAKAFMAEHKIPTANYQSFTDYEYARDYVEARNAPLVIKASGLAAGKGVIMCQDTAEATAALQSIMLDRQFGSAGNEVVIEECLVGPELSILALTDGKTIIPLSPSRDHKRIFDNDEGPNTGGMGAFAPVPDVEDTLLETIHKTILQPTIDGMAANGTPYQGVLFAGLMLTHNGPKVLEFNCRFGDPETQVVLPLLTSDLVEVMLACIEGRLDQTAVHQHGGFCTTVVMASEGYPGSYPKGLKITGIEAANALEGVTVFHAGTARKDGRLLTSGGRVLAVSATGHSLHHALRQSYRAVEHIHFNGAQYRKDIGRING